MFAGRNLLPALAGKFGMLHRVTRRIAQELAAGVEALFLPCRVYIVEKRSCEPEVDLDCLRVVTAAGGISIGYNIQMLYPRI